MTRRLKWLALGLVVVIGLAGIAVARRRVRAADPQRTIVVGGRVRTYRIHLPAGSPGGPRPLVILLHGRGGTGSGMNTLTGFDAVADHHGVIAVYPDGVDHSWADSLNTPAERAGVNDVAFIRALIDLLRSQYSIDRHRIYAAGMSNGAMMTERLGCDLANRIAAIAPVAGPMPQPLAAGCRPTRPLPVLEIHGTDDPIVAYGGGQITGGAGSVLSAPATFSLWGSLDGCRSAATQTSLPQRIDDGTTVQLRSYPRCHAGVAVKLYTVAGGGHTWPDGLPYLPRFLIGRTSRQFNASETIWEFFAAHPGP